MMTDIYYKWLRKTSRVWLDRFISSEVAKVCDGTWGLMSDAYFIETKNPQELIDSLVEGIMKLWFGEWNE